jgi:hypothetical protein
MSPATERDVRFLKAYAVISSLALVFIAATAFRQSGRQRFDEIDVGRINLVEKDGKLRMVMSNVERFPQPRINGKTLMRQSDPLPGMIFYNQDGDENGGLVFGSGTQDGKATADAAILFDQYKQDQTVGIMYSEANGQRQAGLHVWDRPDFPITDIFDQLDAANKLPPAEKEKARQALRDRGMMGAERVFVGKTPDGTASVTLRDGRGKARLVMSVHRAGQPLVEFLDEQGTVTSRFPTTAR